MGQGNGVVSPIWKTEYYCSSKFFRLIHHTTAKKLSKKASHGDAEALAIFREYGKHLGNLIKYILFTYAPEAIVIGGNIRKAYPYFSESMKATINTFPYAAIRDNLTIYTSDMDDTAVMGATALVEESEKLLVNSLKNLP